MRCFVALDVSDEIREKTAKIQENFRISGIKLVEKQNLHFTVKFLGDISEETAEKTREILREIRKPAFDMRISGIGAFPNAMHPRILWAGSASAEMKEMAGAIDSAIAWMGFPRQENYVSHMTIGRIKELAGKEARIRICSIIEQLETIEIGCMKAESISLKESVLCKKGPIYRDVERFSLCP